MWQYTWTVAAAIALHAWMLDPHHVAIYVDCCCCSYNALHES